jgi:ATP-dependent DNA helicase RecG
MFEFDESNELELKSTFKNDAIVKEIVAFLNTNGGTIYVGVNDDKSICGINNIDESMRNLADITMTQIEPLPIDLIQGSIIFREGKSILKIEVLKGTHNLYCIKKYGYS